MNELQSPDHNKVLQWLAGHQNEVLTPFYLYSERALIDATAAYRCLFPDQAPGFYSLKANPQPGLVRYLASLGFGAEIASRSEWQACALAEVEPSRILVGGVSKSEAWLATLCSHNPAALVIESETEWARLKRAGPASRPIPIFLRINPGVSLGGLNMAGGSQFGLSPASGLAIAREATKIAWVDFLGLHFYFGSQRLAVEPILQMVDTVEKIIGIFQQASLRPPAVDLGLGCGVPYLAKDQALAWDVLSEQFRQAWQRPPWSSLDIWFEAGRALTAGAGYFVARVVERKKLHDEIFIFLDGGLNVHNPGLGLGRFLRGHPNFFFITGTARNHEETVHIVGNLCTSADCLGRNVAAPRLVEGDLVVIPNSGAYCMTTGLWGFNSQPLFAEGMLMEDDTLNLLQPQHKLFQSS